MLLAALWSLEILKASQWDRLTFLMLLFVFIWSARMFLLLNDIKYERGQNLQASCGLVQVHVSGHEKYSHFHTLCLQCAPL